MALMRWDPWHDLLGMRSDLARLWASSPWLADAFGAREYPPLNVSVTEGNVTVTLELPGVHIDDVDVTLTGDTLVVKGEKRTNGQGRYERRERYAGRFSRTIHVPDRVERDAIKAKLTDGILTITLPKAEELKPKKITVKPCAEGGA